MTPAAIKPPRGFAYLFLAIILFLVSAIGLTVLADYSFKTMSRQTDMVLLGDVYRAIAGEPAKENFGYLGDTGAFPSRLSDLIQSPGITGWNGPYLTNVRVSGNAIYDSFGSPLECFLRQVTTNPAEMDLAIISKGTDHSSTNTNSDPNDCTTANFSSPYPVGSNWSTYTDYTSNPSNQDNIVYPNLGSSTAAVLNPVGSLAYSLKERDVGFSNTITDGCPLLYVMTINPHTRPTDSITISYNSASKSYNFLQGIYDVVLSGTSGTIQSTVYSESPSVYPSRVNTRPLRVSDIDSTKTTQHSLKVVNYTGAVLTIKVDGTAQGTTVSSGLGSSATYTNIHDCASVTAVNGSTTYDSWLTPWGLTTSTRAVATAANTVTATITNDGTHSSNELIVLQNSLPIGTVYKGSTAVFSVPKGATIVVTQQNNTSVLATYTSITGAITYP